MSVSTVPISLPDELKSAAEAKVVSGRYASISHYVEDLIRQDQRRGGQRELERKMAARITSGHPTVEVTPTDVQQMRAQFLRRASKPVQP